MFAFGKKPHFINYHLENRDLNLQVAFFKGEIWWTQKQLADIFGLTVATVNEHLKKIFKSDDFKETELVKLFSIKAKDNKKYLVNHYHNDILEALQRRVRR